MPRRRKSDFDAWIEVASKLPWWAAIILAVVSYFALHAVASVPLPQPSGQLEELGGIFARQIVRTFAMIGQYLLPVIFIFGAGLSAANVIRNKRLLSQAKQRAGASDLMDLSWQDFEHLVGEAFREQGFAVAETSDGADGGVDLELRRDGELHLVQCKRWRARSVGVEVVRELYGVMAARGAVGGYVVSSGRFSDEAKDFARGRDIDLWDGPKLKAEIRAAPPLPTSAAVARPARRPEEPPACPTCGSEMVKRVARRGSNAVTSRADSGRASRPIRDETQRKVPSRIRGNSPPSQIGTIADWKGRSSLKSNTC